MQLVQLLTKQFSFDNCYNHHNRNTSIVKLESTQRAQTASKADHTMQCSHSGTGIFHTDIYPILESPTKPFLSTINFL